MFCESVEKGYRLAIARDIVAIVVQKIVLFGELFCECVNIDVFHVYLLAAQPLPPRVFVRGRAPLFYNTIIPLSRRRRQSFSNIFLLFFAATIRAPGDGAPGDRAPFSRRLMPLKTLCAVRRLIYRLCRRRRFLPRCSAFGGVLSFSRRRRRTSRAPFAPCRAPLRVLRARVAPCAVWRLVMPLFSTTAARSRHLSTLTIKREFAPLRAVW